MSAPHTAVVFAKNSDEQSSVWCVHTSHHCTIQLTNSITVGNVPYNMGEVRVIRIDSVIHQTYKQMRTGPTHRRLQVCRPSRRIQACI
jgi:hypothetical protein